MILIFLFDAVFEL